MSLALYWKRCFASVIWAPCAFIPMAVHLFPTHAMRSWECPDRFPPLSRVQADKVVLGNALARVAISIASAQISVGMLFCIEQPESSLIWRFMPMRDLIVAMSLFLFAFHAFASGGPWKKPVTGLTYLLELIAIQLYCKCRKPHRVLAGEAPDRRNWTAVAPPYWTALTRELARWCGPMKQAPSERQLSSSNIVRVGFDNIQTVERSP